MRKTLLALTALTFGMLAGCTEQTELPKPVEESPVVEKNVFFMIKVDVEKGDTKIHLEGPFTTKAECQEKVNKRGDRASVTCEAVAEFQAP